MKALQIKLFYARPHPNPLPRGEGTTVGWFNFCNFFASRCPRSICQVTESVSPSPWGEGRGEGDCHN
jgi:hypothetical protein